MNNNTNLIQQGLQYHRSGDLAKAESCYTQVLNQDPNNPDANHLMGLIAKQSGDLDTAVQRMQKAISKNPKFTEAHYNLGNTRWLREELEEAVSCYDRSLELNPEQENAWVNKGRTLQHMGYTEKAAKCFRQAIEVNPQSGKAWENLTFTGKYQKDDPEVEQMRNALEKIDPRSKAANSLHFALGKARWEQGYKDSSMAHYMAGNSIARSQANYDVSTDERLFVNIAKNLDNHQIKRLSSTGTGEHRPIFILGMPRSGTTLIEQILASHPRVMAGGERYDLENVVKNVRFPQNEQIAFPNWVKVLATSDTKKLGQAYLSKLPAASEEGIDRITDKMPGNFRFLGLIHLILPNAAIIHVHRSPADNCLSCYLHNFTNGHAYTFNQTELGRYYRAYYQLMQHWRDTLPQNSFLDVRYEDVVASSEEQIARLLDYCGLEWDDACLKFFETERPVKTASMEQVRQPIYNRAVERWREYTPYLGPLFNALGDLAPDLSNLSGK